MTTTDQKVVPYQQVLRSLGAFLDDEGAEHISILQTAGGFALRYQCGGTEEQLLTKFRLSELPLAHRNGGIVAPRKRVSRYQDFLRALGHELEEEGAWSILLDELEAGFLLSYHYLDPRNRYQPLKRRLRLGPDEQGMIVQYAHSRRANPSDEKGGLFTWLFG